MPGNQFREHGDPGRRQTSKQVVSGGTMTSEAETAFKLAQTSHRPPVDYDRPPTYDTMITEKDVSVAMRDGVKLCVDVYRPDTRREVSRAARLRDLQQGPPGSGDGRDAAAAAGLVAAVDRAGGGRRHALLRLARLRPRDRHAARHRQVGRRRLARLRQLRPDRVDRGAALVRRQCRHDRHFRLRRRAAAWPPSSSRRISRRSSRSIRAAPTAMLGGFREEYPGGVIHLFRYLRRAFLGACTRPRASPARCRPSAKRSGARR